MECRLFLLLGEVCLIVGCANASVKAATVYSNISRVKQKSAEVIVAEH